MSEPRAILHVDMDAFFAAIEQLDHPQLRGKPVLVGGSGPRAVVTTASYEARPFGCHSAQPMSVARRRCPQAIVMPVRGRRYREVSQSIFDIYHRYSPLVQPLSIDEAFIDLTGAQRLFGKAPDVAQRIKQDIKVATGLTASVGVAPNMFLAKLASDIDKPDGLTVITPDMVDTWLPALPVERIWGVGPSTLAKLHDHHVRTIADVRRLGDAQLKRMFGSLGEHIHRLACGIDNRRVTPDSEAKSIGQEQTFSVDVDDADEVRRVMLSQVEQVARRLRRHELLARSVTVKIRYGDFQTITRSVTLDEPTDLTDTIWHASRDLFDQWHFVPVRLIGVTAKDLSHGGQMGLFTQADNTRKHKVDLATDAIVEKFGKGAIRRGG